MSWEALAADDADGGDEHDERARQKLRNERFLSGDRMTGPDDDFGMRTAAAQHPSFEVTGW